VSVVDLARLEKTLFKAKNALAQIAYRTPMLTRHPVFASVGCPHLNPDTHYSQHFRAHRTLLGLGFFSEETSWFFKISHM
jgi:hypothetical protein